MRILLIEDDDETAEFVARGLAEHYHVVERAGNGREALLKATEAGYDVLIVDRMLPEIDGLTVVKMLRAGGFSAAGLFLSTLGGIDDRGGGPEGGGDDYLVKPFALAELVARVNALGRRSAVRANVTTLRVADLELDLLARSTTRAGKVIELQNREFELLEYLMRNAGRVVTKTMLLE